MTDYEYGRIRMLAESLADHAIPQEVMDQILAGGEAIRQSTSPEKKAEWFREAMHRMDNLLERDARHAVREDCACCLGGNA